MVVVVVYLLVNPERAQGVARVIRALRGSSPDSSSEKAITVNIQGVTAQPSQAPSVKPRKGSDAAQVPNVAKSGATVRRIAGRPVAAPL